MKFQCVTESKDQTQQIARRIASVLPKGSVIAMDGDLGAGKTTFTQGLGAGLNVREQINSPTFNILKCYFSGILPLYHIDAYRLEDRINADIGLEEVIQGDGICVIEWADYIGDMVYHPLKIVIEATGETERRIRFETDDEKYAPVFRLLEEMTV